MKSGVKKKILKDEKEIQKRVSSYREFFKLTRVILPGGTDIHHSGFGRTPMAPLNDLIDILLIPSKRLPPNRPAVSHPAFTPSL